MKIKTLLLLGGTLFLSAFTTAQAQLATIIYNPTNNPGQNSRVDYIVNQMGSAYGATGAALKAWALDPGVTVYITINENQNISSTVVNGVLHVNLNDHPSYHFLSPSDYSRALGHGEAPANGVIALGHEFGHGIVNPNHPAGPSYRLQRESDVIQNYENHLRAASGQDPRTTYSLQPIQQNQSAWQTFANWIREIFE